MYKYNTSCNTTNTQAAQASTIKSSLCSLRNNDFFKSFYKKVNIFVRNFNKEFYQLQRFRF